MNPHQSFQNQILQIIEQTGGISAKNIRLQLGISEPTLFKHLQTLVTLELVQKAGKTPKVLYYPAPKPSTTSSKFILKYDHKFLMEEYTKALAPIFKKTIEDNYLQITPDGRLLYGLEGFAYWCTKQGLDLEKTSQEYCQTLQKYDAYKQNGVIDAGFKLQESFGNNSALDNLFYLEFYALERFGKTKLAQLSFQAKQSQDPNLMKQIIELTKNRIIQLTRELKIEVVAFIPPTVDRKVQFQTELKNALNLPLPHLTLLKLILDTPVQQKTLKSKEDRIINASSTIFVDDNRQFNNILLIDDFVGSGATLNETAKKIRKRGLISGPIYALGLTGSFNGFEVVSQM